MCWWKCWHNANGESFFPFNKQDDPGSLASLTVTSTMEKKWRRRVKIQVFISKMTSKLFCCYAVCSLQHGNSFVYNEHDKCSDRWHGNHVNSNSHMMSQN